MKSLYIYISLLSVLLFTGCIKNDIPYPHIPLEIKTLSVEGENAPVKIDPIKKEILISLKETADIRHLKINELQLTDKAETKWKIGDYIDLSSPRYINLHLYYDVTWKVQAEQNINYIFNIENQIGSKIINKEAHNIMVYFNPKKSQQQNITITNLKLGPEGITTISPDWRNIHDFREPQKVTVKYHDITEEWMIMASAKNQIANTLPADAWVTGAWLHGTGMAGNINGFEYRVQGGEWQKVPQGNISGEETISAYINKLTPNTTYEYRAFSNDDFGDVLSFTTKTPVALVNGSMDYWTKELSPSKKVLWEPWNNEVEQFWDTGNTGVTKMKDSNSAPTKDIWKGKKDNLNAVKLESLFVGIGSFGKFAAGNLFTGKYIATDGTNGILDFGKPFSSYPTHLKGYYKYHSTPITDTDDNHKYLMGKADTCTIYIALCNWDSPLRIRTNPKSRQLFDKNDRSVIAYAELSTAQSSDEYQPFDLELKYRYTNIKPKYILIVCSASKYGDFFTGGQGSTLYVDELSLSYE